MMDALVYDVAVLGLGAMGSSAAYHLSRRGVKVLGIDRYNPPHSWGSSHGETRVIREAYFEHPSYVPLVQRAYELWADLEKESGEELYVKTGGLMFGPPESTVVRGAIRSAREHHLDHEVLDSAEIRARFRGLNPEHGMIGVWETRAGILYPEKCVAAHLRLAGGLGADLRRNEQVLGWQTRGDTVVIETARATYVARELFVTAGPWVGETIPRLSKLFTVERQVLLWFAAQDPSFFGPKNFPIYLSEYEPNKMFYGFPDLGSGVKIAFHGQGVFSDPEAVERNVSAEDIAKVRVLLEKYLPKANGEFLRGTVCLYTNSPDGHFIIDRHPDAPRVIVASPCSGHGFKFASAIGEVLADLVLNGRSSLDLSLFRLDRFG